MICKCGLCCEAPLSISVAQLRHCSRRLIFWLVKKRKKKSPRPYDAFSSSVLWKRERRACVTFYRGRFIGLVCLRFRNFGKTRLPRRAFPQSFAGTQNILLSWQRSELSSFQVTLDFPLFFFFFFIETGRHIYTRERRLFRSLTTGPRDREETWRNPGHANYRAFAKGRLLSSHRQKRIKTQAQRLACTHAHTQHTLHHPAKSRQRRWEPLCWPIGNRHGCFFVFFLLVLLLLWFPRKH